MKTITAGDTTYLQEAASLLEASRNAVALTGAGISVESGIDDFRSPGGLWSRFPIEEYGTIEAFRRNPEKAWQLFRCIGGAMAGKKPNAAHLTLAELERRGLLKGIVTQNIDGLHQEGGSRRVVEIHGEHRHLHCIDCGCIEEAEPSLPESDIVPRCSGCGAVLKPNVVLFGEQVRALDEIHLLLHRCDLLVVVGTSAQVYPAAALPQQVRMQGGRIFEFNTTETVLTSGRGYEGTRSDYFFHGSASKMLSLLRKQLGI